MQAQQFVHPMLVVLPIERAQDALGVGDEQGDPDRRRQPIEAAQRSAVLAANQGLYNGFLAAGLIWGLIHGNAAFAFQIKAFFLLCVIVAGAYGAATVSRRILYVQAAPAALALILLWLV